VADTITPSTIVRATTRGGRDTRDVGRSGK